MTLVWMNLSAGAEPWPDDIRARILEVQEKAGFIPNVFLAFARRPAEWRAFFAYHDALMTPEADGRTMVQAGHRRAKFVVYPIGPVQPDGLQPINWIADRRLREDGFGGGLTAPDRADWSQPGQLSDLLPTFSRWRFAWLDVPGLMHAASQILEWPMVDRDPLPRWSFGRMTLLGDAAHPMYPIGSNGATQAILDARALADALATGGDPTLALAAYEAARRPMTTRIVTLNRQEGLDAILDMVEERAPQGFAQISDVMNPDELARWVHDYKRAAGHQQSAVAQAQTSPRISP